MKVLIGFRFGPVHTPVRRNGWNNSNVIQVGSKNEYYDLVITKPIRVNTHDLEEEGRIQGKIADSYIGLLVATEFPKTTSDFKKLAESVVSSVTPIIEEFRIKTRQPHLRLRHIADLESGTVQTLDGKELPELTAKFKVWMESETGGRPLPYVSKENWAAVIGNDPNSIQTPLERMSRCPFYESILLDADLALDSDSRMVVMFSALACEVFIQSWLEKQAATSPRLKYWLECTDPRLNPDKAASIRTYFDLGLFLASGKSMKEDKSLWKSFNDLIKARNDVAHRGRLSGDFIPINAVITAREVVSWVKDLESSIIETNFPKHSKIVLV